MLLPKHDVPSSPQDTANGVQPVVDTDITGLKRTDTEFSPQYESQKITNFGQQLTEQFAQQKLTDSLGNFRPGEALPPIVAQIDKTTLLSPQEDKASTKTVLSPQDNEYMTANMNENDNIKTGFLENMFKAQETAETKNYDLRPGSETSDYIQNAYWNSYEPSDPIMTLKSNIASPDAQLQQLEYLQQTADDRPNSLSSPAFTDSATLVDISEPSNIQAGTRPGEVINSDNTLIGEAGTPIVKTLTADKVSPRTDGKKTAYPNPKRFGWNYFNDQKKEDEARDKQKEKAEIERQFNSQGLYYPNPSPFKYKNGSMVVKGDTKTPVAPAPMKVKVKVEQTEDGQYVMRFNGPLKGAKVLIAPTTKTPTRSTFQDALNNNENIKNDLGQTATIGAKITEEKSTGAKEKTVSIKVPTNVSLSTVLKNIYQHMYQSYFNKRPDQNGGPHSEEEAKKIIEGLVSKDMQNLPSILINSTDKKSETGSQASPTPNQKDDSTKMKDYLQKMFDRQVKVSKEMQQQHNAAHEDSSISDSQPQGLQQQQQFVNPWAMFPQQQQWAMNAPASSFSQSFYTPTYGQETQGFVSNAVQQQQQVPLQQLPGVSANGMLNLNVQVPPVLVSSANPPTSITLDQGDSTAILKSVRIPPLQYAEREANTMIQSPPVTRGSLSNYATQKSKTSKKILETKAAKKVSSKKADKVSSKKTLPKHFHMNKESDLFDGEPELVFMPAGKLQKFIGSNGGASKGSGTMDHEPIENFLKRLEDDKEMHKEAEFNKLASKMLGIPLSLIKQEHDSEVSEKEKKVKKSKMSGQSTPHVDNKATTANATKSGPAPEKPRSEPTAVQYNPTQWVSADSMHPVVVKDVESFVRQQNPDMFKSESPLNNFAYQQPQAIQNYYTTYQYRSGQYGQYPASFYGPSNQWSLNNVRNKVVSSPNIRVIAPLRHTTISPSKAAIADKKAAIGTQLNRPLDMTSYSQLAQYMYPATAYNWQYPSPAENSPNYVDSTFKEYNNVPNFESPQSVFQSDPFEGTKRSGIPANTKVKQKLLLLRKRQANEKGSSTRGTKKQKRASDVPQKDSSKKTKISVSSQAKVIITRSGGGGGGGGIRKPTASASAVKRSKILQQKPIAVKKSPRKEKNHRKTKSKQQQNKHSKKTVAAGKNQVRSADESKPTAWFLNSTFVENLNERFAKQQIKARKSEIMHHHKQPKLMRKGKKRIVIQREHESLTKGIMKNALNLTFIQPTIAASNITTGIDRLLRNHTILSEVIPGNDTNALAESFSLNTLKEETGSSRSNIDDSAFAGRLDSLNNHVFNDEAMGSKSRAENLGADDVEESLMKSMEVIDDGESNRKKKKSSVPMVTKKTYIKDDEDIAADILEVRNVKKSTVPSNTDLKVTKKKSSISMVTKKTSIKDVEDIAADILEIKNVKKSVVPSNTDLKVTKKKSSVSMVTKKTPIKDVGDIAADILGIKNVKKSAVSSRNLKDNKITKTIIKKRIK